MRPLFASIANTRSFLKNVWLMRLLLAARGLVPKLYWANREGEARLLMSYRFRLSAVVVLLEKTPAARFRVQSSPTPISPVGKWDATRTLADEIRAPPRFTV